MALKKLYKCYTCFPMCTATPAAPMAANATQQESMRAAPTAAPVIIPAWGED